MITLLLVDVQNDFHPPNGSLAIPSALDDANRIAQLIRDHGKSISRVIATMDTHPILHIAHPRFWIEGNGGDLDKCVVRHPDPFTIITAEDIISRKWIPRPDLVVPPSDFPDPAIFDDFESIMVKENSNDFTANDITEKEAFVNTSSLPSSTVPTLDLLQYCIQYTKRLEMKGKFKLCIWPEHCILGSSGHCIVDVVQQALNEWTSLTGRNVEYVLKGQNMLTEMFSALSAEVPITLTTSKNQALQKSILSPLKSDGSLNKTAPTLLVAGQAMSHCVNYTLRDILSNNDSCGNICSTTNSDKSVDELQQHTVRTVLLTDCASAVPGFEADALQFMKDMELKGVELVASVDLILP